MKDLRGYGLILVIAVLITVFSLSLVWAIYDQPKYEDYCKSRFPAYAPAKLQPQDCTEIPYPEQGCDKGDLETKFDAKGCPKEYVCEMCRLDFEKENSKYNLRVFILLTIFGAIAIGIGLLLPQKGNPLNELVGTGFLLGGVISIFVGTVHYFNDANKIARPIIILAELLLVLYLAYKKIKLKK